MLFLSYFTRFLLLKTFFLIAKIIEVLQLQDDELIEFEFCVCIDLLIYQYLFIFLLIFNF